MIFRRELAEMIFAGRKTQTRRPVKEGEERCKYVPERTYAIQLRRGGKQIGRLMVLDTHRERLGAITEKAAKAEGFKSRDEFLTYWARLYDHEPDLEQQVWVIHFVNHDVRLLNRSGGYPYYTDDLTAGMRGGEEGGEPEYVPDSVQTDFDKDARRRWSEHEEEEKSQQVAEQQGKQLARKLRRIQTDAAKLGVDIAPRLIVMIREAEAELAAKRKAA